MRAERRIIVCGICGHKMVIPPQYANTPGRCRVCGGVVNAGNQHGGGPLDSDIRPARPKPAGPQKRGKNREIRHVILSAVLWGVAGALAGGILNNLLVAAMKSQSSTSPTIGSYFASGDTGGLIGFVLCFSWRTIHKFNTGPLFGMLIAVAVSVPLGILLHLIESAFVAPPDLALWQTAVVALFGGAIAGFVLGMVTRDQD